MVGVACDKLADEKHVPTSGEACEDRPFSPDALALLSDVLQVLLPLNPLQKGLIHLASLYRIIVAVISTGLMG